MTVREMKMRPTWDEEQPFVVIICLSGSIISLGRNGLALTFFSPSINTNRKTGGETN